MKGEQQADQQRKTNGKHGAGERHPKGRRPAEKDIPKKKTGKKIQPRSTMHPKRTSFCNKKKKGQQTELSDRGKARGGSSYGQTYSHKGKGKLRTASAK